MQPRYEIKKTDLHSIILNTINGQYLLPYIQRDYKWSLDNEKALFDSLLNGYPIRDLLILQPSEDSNSVFSPKVFERVTEARKNSQECKEFQMVLDGQQRITAASIIHSGYSQKYREELQKRGRRSRPKELFIRVSIIQNLIGELRSNSGQQGQDEYGFDSPEWKSALKSVRAALSLESDYLVHKQVRSSTDRANMLNQQNDPLLWTGFLTNTIENRREIEKAKQNGYLTSEFAHFAENYLTIDYKNRNVGIEIIDAAVSTDDIAKMFTMINTKGKLLNVFEILCAIYSSSKDPKTRKSIELRSDIEAQRESSCYDNLEKVSVGDYFIQAIALFLGEPHQLGKLTSSVSANDYLDQKSVIYESFIWLGEFLHALGAQTRTSRKYIPYPAQIPALVALVRGHVNFEAITKACELEKKKKETSDTQEKIEIEQDLENLEKQLKNNREVEKVIKEWFFLAPLLNRYNESVPARLNSDFQAFNELLTAKLKGKASDQHRPDWCNSKNIRPEEVAKADAGSAMGKAVICLLAKKLTKDFFSPEELSINLVDENPTKDVQLHHLHPLNVENCPLKKNLGDEAAKKELNAATNMIWISRKSNGAGGIANLSPRSYLSEEASRSRTNFYKGLEEQFVNQTTLSYLKGGNNQIITPDTFKEFRLNRAKEVINAVEKLTT